MAINLRPQLFQTTEATSSLAAGAAVDPGLNSLRGFVINTPDNAGMTVRGSGTVHLPGRYVFEPEINYDIGVGQSYTTTTSSSTSATPVKKDDPALVKLKGDLLIKLLEIEGVRCKSKPDEEERGDSLANLLEGDETVLARVQAGMNKYLTLLGYDVVEPHIPAPPVGNQVPMTTAEMNFWYGLKSMLQPYVPAGDYSRVTAVDIQTQNDPRSGYPLVMLKYRMG